MKILVMSDTHGYIDNAVLAVGANEDLDMIIHLGDVAEDFEKIKYLCLNNEINLTNKEVIFHNVLGNVDNDVHGDYERILEIEGHRLLICHGHKYRVKMTDDLIFYRGKEMEVHAVIYGHTHLSRNDEIQGLKLLNPGSISLPKGKFGPSYMLLNIESGRLEAELKIL